MVGVGVYTIHTVIEGFSSKRRKIDETLLRTTHLTPTSNNAVDNTI